jgi:hypothetical protein
VRFRPLYCWIFAGLANCTGKRSAWSPSTSQYQLYVDSTATPWSCGWKGWSAWQIVGNSLASRC